MHIMSNFQYKSIQSIDSHLLSNFHFLWRFIVWSRNWSKHKPATCRRINLLLLQKSRKYWRCKFHYLTIPLLLELPVTIFPVWKQEMILANMLARMIPEGVNLLLCFLWLTSLQIEYIAIFRANLPSITCANLFFHSFDA